MQLRESLDCRQRYLYKILLARYNLVFSFDLLSFFGPIVILAKNMPNTKSLQNRTRKNLGQCLLA